MTTVFAQAVYAATCRIPLGRVASYAAVAQAIGVPRAMRAVGNALHRNPTPQSVPCHRVVRSDGDLGGYVHGRRKKITLLRGEGIMVSREGRLLSAVQFLKLES